MKGILSLAAESAPTDLRRLTVVALGDGIQEMGLGRGQIMGIHLYLSCFIIFLLKTSDTNMIQC